MTKRELKSKFVHHFITIVLLVRCKCVCWGKLKVSVRKDKKIEQVI